MHYIYNETSNLEAHIHEAWLIWIKGHIKQILATNLFENAHLLKVLINDNLQSVTYTVQYVAKSREALDTFIKQHAQAFQNEARLKFGDQLLTFQTELQFLETY